MPVQIGQRQSDFADPLGLLSECHRRIERFLGVLAEVAGKRRGAVMAEDEAASFAKALDYFRAAAPKHTRDEEDSLFPRMRQAGGEAITAAMAAIEELEADHLAADACHREIETCGRRWLDNGCLEETEAKRLIFLLDRLTALYERHIAVEDRELFPLAAKALGKPDIAAIGAEMAARRSIA